MKLASKYAATLLTLIFCTVLVFAHIILIQFGSQLDLLNSRSAQALRDSVLNEIRAKEVFSTRVLAAGLTNPLYQLDMLKINELVSAVKKQPDVLYVHIYDEKRRIIHDGTSELSLYDSILDDDVTVKSMRAARLMTSMDGDTLHVAMPITIQDDLVGGVKVGYSLRRIQEDIAQRQKSLEIEYQNTASGQIYAIGLVAVVTSIGGLIAAILLARNWSKPISLLSSLIARVGKGNYDITIPINRSDEIGQLAKSFSGMVTYQRAP